MIVSSRFCCNVVRAACPFYAHVQVLCEIQAAFIYEIAVSAQASWWKIYHGYFDTGPEQEEEKNLTVLEKETEIDTSLAQLVILFNHPPYIQIATELWNILFFKTNVMWVGVLCQKTSSDKRDTKF